MPINRDILAQVLVDILGPRARGDKSVYRTRLNDRSYYAKVRSNYPIMAIYEMRTRGAHIPRPLPIPTIRTR
jgi:hypothetical protein